IAMSFANAGIAVRLIDASPEALERAGAQIASNYASQVQRGKSTQAEADERARLIVRTGSFDDLAAVDVAIEAVFEDMAIKREVFGRLGAICAPGTLLATNTSTLDVDEIAHAAPHAERTIGMHFFSPAHIMKLLEIVRGADTSAETIAATVALGERLGKVPVVVGNCDGFVGNRMLLGTSAKPNSSCSRALRPSASMRPSKGSASRWVPSRFPISRASTSAGARSKSASSAARRRRSRSRTFRTRW
ncbi:MAG: 3-hydroxyacyl-CoA dehydrogenase family protein, partial [Candidatus Eremiobacteraeota bacterium]|nr:3-hydroxyacyl-CoA dehydrogenase family protein [Candidatus Eremiobacteraeota bacterium]